MTQNKQEHLIEQKVIIGLSIILAGGAFIGTFLAPIFDTALAVNFNHIMISVLPDSFDSLKFTSNDSEVFQKGQLIFANLPLLLFVSLYYGSYILVLSTVNKRPSLKTMAYLLGSYCVFYAMGGFVSQLLKISA